MEEKHLKLKHRIAFSAAMSGFFCISLLIFAPLSLYISGNDEMWFSFRSLLLPIFLASVICFLIGGAILTFVPKPAHKILCCLTYGVALGFYLQCAFFNISYGSGVLDGSQIAWRDYTTYGAIDMAMWAACIALPFALYMVFKRSWRHALMISAAFIVLLQAGSLAVNIYKNQNRLDKLTHEVTTQGMYELSSKDNTIVFVLSSMDNAYYEKYKESHPKVTETLSGFTEYDNTLSTGAGTMVSLPSMLTGNIYKKDIKYTTFINNTWNSKNVYDLLTQNGVDVRIYCDDLYFGNGAVRKIGNVVDRAQDAAAYRSITGTIYRYTLYKCMPHYLKQFFWMSLKDYSSYKSNITYTPNNDAKFFSGYSQAGGFQYTNNYSSALRIYHLQGAKAPYRLNSDGAKVKTETSLEEQVEGEFNSILRIVRDLKKSGRYENTRIIITADNGDLNISQNPLLLYKDKGESEGYTTSDAPVSLFDLPATLASTVTADYASYGSGVTFKDAEKAEATRTRSFYRNAGSNADSRIEEYTCSGPANDPASMKLIEKYYINGGKIDNYVLGTELTFTTDETAAIYCKAGFGHTNGWRTIMRGKKAVMEIPIESVPDNLQDLHAYFNVLTVYEKTRCVIYANGTRIYSGQLDSVVRRNGLNFLIPTRALDGNNLRLEFVFPDIKDDATNVMALTSFKIYHQ